MKPSTDTGQVKRVLLLDDDPFILHYLEDMLTELGGMEVRCHSDGKGALALMKQWVPDLLICDVSMPSMDGLEFLRLASQMNFHGGVALHTSVDASLRKAAEILADAHGLQVLGSYRKAMDRGDIAAILQRASTLSTERPRSAPVASLTIEELREGIAEGRVEVYYQPKVSLRRGNMVGVECLARYRHPTRGVLPPSAFVHLVEQYQLIDEFTMVVLCKGAQQLAEWLKAGHHFKIAVNVSMDNLNRTDLPEVFQHMVRQAGIEPQHVTLEMTETRLMADPTLSLEILARLRLKGFGLSIDDFGTGFSTMENLKRLPFNELKIDRAFVDGASADTATRSMLSSSVRLGREFSLTVVAEGVEKREDWDVLTEMGVDQVQGFYVARPMPGDEVLKWKTDWEQRRQAKSVSVVRC
jgi:EAL domain-containing protein (putative c-di-GMP-specific phosphodiesterase class I)/ActR/RegA family two-component response regulator